MPYVAVVRIWVNNLKRVNSRNASKLVVSDRPGGFLPYLLQDFKPVWESLLHVCVQHNDCD